MRTRWLRDGYCSLYDPSILLHHIARVLFLLLRRAMPHLPAFLAFSRS